MENLCVACKKNPIVIKKRKLCYSCYQRLVRAGKTSPAGSSRPSIQKSKNVREIQFIKNFFTHQNWTYEPAMFRMDGEKYSPDFYDGERNVFIEVVGSRQAYFENKHKYKLLRKYYPKIKFEIRTKNGDLLDEEKSINSQV